jgi:hypothetical protein
LRVYNALGKVLIKDGQVISEENEFGRNIIVAQQKNPRINFRKMF